METISPTYDSFSPDWYQKVEKIVLENYRFNVEQKKFIHHFESSVIEAGPGSGKTTALSAKVALLFKKLEEEGAKAGVCVITHTNAAVEEVKKVLNKIGYTDIPHPHFIGTINEFFNKFGMYPYLKIFKPDIDVRFYEELHLTRYLRSKLSIKHPWMNNPNYAQSANRVLKRLVNSHLFFNKEGNLDCYLTYQNDSFDKYKEDYLYYKEESWEEGIYDVNDTFPLAQKYLEYEKVKERLRDRFRYLLMDEYQDVSPLALQLLKEVFNTKENVFQMIGDSNQHISYGNPEVPTDGFKKYFLNQTNRFGNNISNILNKIFNVSLKSTYPEKSLNPIICLYNEPNKLLECFARILEENKIPIKDEEVALLVSLRKQANKLEGILTKTTPKNKRNNFQLAQDLIYRLIAEKVQIQTHLIRTGLHKDHTNHKLKINKSLLEYFRDNSNIKNIKDEINSTLYTLGVKARINKKNNLFKELEKIKSSNNVNAISKSTAVPIKTIHDLKGQTQTANMVFLERNSYEEYAFLENYTSLLSPPRYYKDINKRVLFVGLSRVTSLLLVALNEKTFNQLTEDSRLKLKADFEIIMVNEMLEDSLQLNPLSL